MSADEDLASEVIILSDEELLALEDPLAGVLPRPWADELSGPEARIARECGLRSLWLRGLAAPDPDAPDGLLVNELLEGVLAARGTTARMALLQIAAPSGGNLCYLHIDPLGTLLERVTGEGFHVFSLVDNGALGDYLQGEVPAELMSAAPQQSEGGLSPEPAVGVTAADALISVDLVICPADSELPPEIWSVIFTAQGCFSGMARLGDPHGPSFERQDAHALGRWWATACLADLPEPGVDDGS